MGPLRLRVLPFPAAKSNDVSFPQLARAALGLAELKPPPLFANKNPPIYAPPARGVEWFLVTDAAIVDGMPLREEKATGWRCPLR